MKTRKTTKRALLLSIFSIMLCLVMLIGTTFAWFTDTASTAVNKIESGILDVDIVDANGDSLDGKSLSFKNVKGETDILWEPGATFTLDSFRIVNKGSLAFKYKVILSGVNGNAELLEAIDFTVGGEPLTEWEGILLPEGKTPNEGTDEMVGATDDIVISGTMKQTAGNEYQGLTLDGVGITVVATQYTYEYDSNNNTYDAAANDGTRFYTLAEFNQLIEIPANVDTLYVNLNGASLDGGLTIGNANIADHYHYTEWNQDVAPAGYPLKTSIDNFTTHDGDKVRYIYSTGKDAVNIILTGSVLGAKDTGRFGAGSIKLMVPDAANVTFEKVTFGAGQMTLSMWTEAGVQSMTVAHRVASVTFDGCTFNGNWLQGGDAGANELVFKNSIFSKYENTADANQSNPIWIQNNNGNVTIEGCIFNAVRPIKLWESNGSGTATIKNNTFIMSKCTGDTEDTHKNIGIMFCQGKLNNTEVTGNTVKGDATALICFYNDGANYPTLNEGATFKLSGNTMLDGAKESVLWKTTTEWKPDYVNK